MALHGVILNIDGTLVLSNDAQAQAWTEAFAGSGYDIPFEQIQSLIGMGGDQVIPKLVPGLNDQQGEGKAIAEQRKELILNRYAQTLAPARGSRDLVLQDPRWWVTTGHCRLRNQSRTGSITENCPN